MDADSLAEDSMGLDLLLKCLTHKFLCHGDRGIEIEQSDREDALTRAAEAAGDAGVKGKLLFRISQITCDKSRVGVACVCRSTMCLQCRTDCDL